MKNLSKSSPHIFAFVLSYVLAERQVLFGVWIDLVERKQSPSSFSREEAGGTRRDAFYQAADLSAEVFARPNYVAKT